MGVTSAARHDVPGWLPQFTIMILQILAAASLFFTLLFITIIFLDWYEK